MVSLVMMTGLSLPPSRAAMIWGVPSGVIGAGAAPHRQKLITTMAGVTEDCMVMMLLYATVRVVLMG
ncbi:hypothetical protein AA0616_0366 [Komagataeibacter nataicola NRIC 0616]|nr:hypothetical protein AA0616_0366 [Komagataeibacter nataicola NRIC 0616]